ncbi:MAG: hypothetical protein OXH36_04240 [Bdellovibrionales bacterium]|nr:hypothetical protein [Bdellovibrionales bacterium]
MKKTIVYIDGFNLYYRIKYTPYRWLSLQKLSQYYLDLKQNQIINIKYFTAKVKRKSVDSSFSGEEVEVKKLRATVKRLQDERDI